MWHAYQQIRPNGRESVSRWHWVVPIAALILRLSSSATADVSYFVIGIYGALGKRNAIESYCLMWFFNMLSDGIAPPPTFGTIDRYVAIILITAGIIFRNLPNPTKVGSRPIVLETLLLGAFLLLHALFFSTSTEISLLKSTLFLTVFLGLIATWSELSVPECHHAVRFMYYGLAFVLVASLPTATTGLGYLRNGTGFQGILNHPQVFGPSMALLASWSAARTLTAHQFPVLNSAIAVGAITGVYLSEARTAGGALFLGVLLSLVSVGLQRRSRALMSQTVKSGRLAIIAFAALVGIILGGAILSEGIVTFLSKSGRAQSVGLFEAFDNSRGGLMATMLDNIADNPLMGIGFGIASDQSSIEIERDFYFGLPISMPSEKGVLPIAVLEEIGIVGFGFVAVWTAFMLKRTYRRGIGGLVLVTVTFFVNCGESMFFSPGGMGLLFMLGVSLAVSRGEVNDAVV